MAAWARLTLMVLIVGFQISELEMVTAWSTIKCHWISYTLHVRSSVLLEDQELFNTMSGLFSAALHVLMCYYCATQRTCNTISIIVQAFIVIIGNAFLIMLQNFYLSGIVSLLYYKML